MSNPAKWKLESYLPRFGLTSFRAGQKEVIATVLGIPIAVPTDGDFGAAFGAARLGLIAAEGADPFVVCAPPTIRETVEPLTELAEAYAAAHATYCDLYPAIKEAMPQ